jgi:hypothetical protein
VSALGVFLAAFVAAFDFAGNRPAFFTRAPGVVVVGIQTPHWASRAARIVSALMASTTSASSPLASRSRWRASA